MRTSERPRLTILGSGWATTKLLSSLQHTAWDVQVISPQPYWCYTPLLAAVAVGQVGFSTIVEPVRSHRRPTVQYTAAFADSIDFQGKKVTCRPAVAEPWTEPQRLGSAAPDLEHRPSFEVAYDKLVIAIGCDTADFGTKGARENALFLKNIKDAWAVRNRILECFELANLPGVDRAEQERPTGVELAGHLHDLIKTGLKGVYSQELRDRASICILDIADTVLPGFDQHLQQRAKETFGQEGIKFLGKRHIEEVGPGYLVTKEDSKISCGLVVWSTGLAPVSLLKQMSGAKQDEKTKNLIVDDFLHVQSADGQAFDDVYAMGDMATPESGPLPPVGVVADQQGEFLARYLDGVRLGKYMREPFEFQDAQKVSYLGDSQTADETNAESKISSSAAWALWRERYSRTLSTRKRVEIAAAFLHSKLFGRDVTRI